MSFTSIRIRWESETDGQLRVLMDAPLMDRSLPNMPQRSAAPEPVMSISQFAHMLEAEAAKKRE